MAERRVSGFARIESSNDSHLWLFQNALDRDEIGLETSRRYFFEKHEKRMYRYRTLGFGGRARRVVAADFGRRRFQRCGRLARGGVRAESVECELERAIACSPLFEISRRAASYETCGGSISGRLWSDSGTRLTAFWKHHST